MSRIYLDHASAMPVDPRVAQFALPYLQERYGNASSLHAPGLMAKTTVEEARGKVAALINARSARSIIFCASATEANNLAVRGTALRNRNKGTKVAVSAIEHISVLNPMKDLRKSGFELAVIPVDRFGLIDPGSIDELVPPGTVLTSVNYANDEIGTIEPVRQIAEKVHENGSLLHVNATAAAGRIPIDVQQDGIDLLTLSSNDLYGPQGAAALYIGEGVKCQPVLMGGGQERGLRPGTENLFALAGMGEAARIAKEEMAMESARLTDMRDRLIREMLNIEDSYLTGHPTMRLPHHASFRFSRIEGESIQLNLDMFFDIQIATGSACSSRTLEPSHVLLAIGLKHEEAHGSMVTTLGRSNNSDQIPVIIDGVKQTVARLREISAM